VHSALRGIQHFVGFVMHLNHADDSTQHSYTWRQG